MYRYALYCLALLLVAGAFDSRLVRAADPQGSGNLTGIIADSNDKPMTGFAVKLYQSAAIGADSPAKKKTSFDQPAPSELLEKLVTTATTDAQGKFTISNVKSGGYLVKGGSKNVGYLYTEATVEAGKTTDMGRIKLVK